MVDFHDRTFPTWQATMNKVWLIGCVLLGLISCCYSHDDYTVDDEAMSYVTYGSLIKLMHTNTGYRLHSHEVAYGTGSRQQSVTGYSQPDDLNSFWILKEPHGGEMIPQGTPLKHGDRFRLQHIRTSKNLHSHQHRAPLSAGLEVSCFGNGGEGDEGDNWMVDLPGRTGFWKRGEPIRIRHEVENTYLASHSKAFPRPIEGQHEVKAITKKSDSLCLWHTVEGVYFEAIFPTEEQEE